MFIVLYVKKEDGIKAMKYKDIPYDELLDYGIEYNDTPEPCFSCKDDTEWFDTYFKVPSCSQKCSRTISREILNEVKRLNDVVVRLEKRMDNIWR